MSFYVQLIKGKNLYIAFSILLLNLSTLLFVNLDVTTPIPADYFPINDLSGAQNIAGYENMSSLPTGQVTIQEKNICPSTYHGGTLFRVTQFFRSLTNAMIVNNEIYVQRPTKLPPGVQGNFQETVSMSLDLHFLKLE